MDWPFQDIHDSFDEVDRCKTLPRKGLTLQRAANEVDRRWKEHFADQPDPDGYFSGLLSIEFMIAAREDLDHHALIDVLYRRATKKG